jgi:MFS transporter, putative metabolite:H+ symporter
VLAFTAQRAPLTTTTAIAPPTVAARIDRLPNTRYTRRLIIFLSLGGCFELYDLFLMAYIGPGFFNAKLFSPTTEGAFDLNGFASFIAATFTGLFIGTILFSWVSDRLGRRSVFTYSLLWYSAATFVMAFQNTAQALDLWRLIASIGIGVELVNIDTYLSELVPKERRGAAFAFNQFVQFLAVPAVAFLAWALIPRTILGLEGWRWVVMIGATGALVIWWIRLSLPESPRWLAEHGHRADAERVIGMMEARVAQETGRPLPPPETVAGEAEARRGAWIEMWRGPYLKRTIILSVYNLFQTIGYYGFASWVPTLLISQGITTTRSLEYTFIIALAAPIGPLIGVLFADMIDRKWQIAWAAIAIAVFGLLFSQQTSAAGVIICGILITLANNWLSFSFHAYQAELYPTRIRAMAVGFVYSWSRFSTIFSGYLIAFLLRAYGTTGVFVFIALAMLVVVAVISGFGPRTSRLRLEAISR